MVISEADKQKAFDDAIARFHAVAAADSETAKSFLSAKTKIVKKLESSASAKRKPGAPIMPVSVSKEYEDIFFINGKVSDGPNILCYLDDAVLMYQKRTDAHAGEAALLFDPRNKHIKAIRKLIEAYTGSGHFDAKSPEFAAAKAVEKALDDVQNAHYLPKGKKSDGSTLAVYGYSGLGDKVQGTGIVCRDYGSRQDIGRYQILEIGSEGLLAHLAESNAITSSMNYQVDNRLDARNDISVISRNGTVSKFHHSSVGKDIGYRNNFQRAYDVAMQSEPSIQKVEGFKSAKYASGTVGIDMRFSDGEIAVVEKELIPFLEQQLPALTTIPPKQRTR